MFSKPGSFVRRIGALSAGALLAACMTEQTAPQHGGHGGHGGHGPMMGGQAGAATASGAPAAASPDQTDMRRMCPLHHDMQKASPAERQAMMEQHMQGMSPEMRRQQMKMLQQHCR